MDLFLFLTLLLCIPLIETTNTDCNGKSFHCVNSTHFMICVDVGGGVSMTIGNFVLPCPPTTFCLETNSFECEFRTLTTQKSIFQKSDVANELNEINATTIANSHNLPGNDSSKTANTFVLPLQKYYSNATTNEILEDNEVNTIPSTSFRSIVKNETVNNNGNNRKDNINSKLKPEISIDLNNMNKSKLHSLDPKSEFEQIVNRENEMVDMDTNVKLTHGSFTTEIFPGNPNSNFSSAVTTLKSVNNYNPEDFTQNNIIINMTENSTSNSLINSTGSNLFTDVSKNYNSVIAKVTTETTELINTFFSETQHGNFSETNFISDKTNGSLKDANTKAFLSNFSSIDEEINNNAANEEVNVQLNMVSDNNDMFASSENVYATTKQQFTTENTLLLTQTNSYITMAKRKQPENVTNKIYQDPIFIATTEETLTAINTESFQEKSITTYPDHIEMNSTPIPKMCSQNGSNIICLENDDSLNTINENTKIITAVTSLSSLEGAKEVTTSNLLNTDKDYFTINDETGSTNIINSTDNSDLLNFFTHSVSENKPQDINPSTLPNYLINTTILIPFNQQSNEPSTIENIVTNKKIKHINISLTTESIPIVHIFSGFESAATTIKSEDYFNFNNINENISDIKNINDSTKNYLKIGASGKVNQEKTNIFETETEILDKTINEIDAKILGKLQNNKQYNFNDKMFSSDWKILNDALVTTMNNDISFSNITSTTNELLLNNTAINEEYNTQQNKISDFTTEGFYLLEQTNNNGTTLKNTRPENLITLYPDIILAATTANTATATFFNKRIQDEYVTSQPIHENITIPTLVSRTSDQNNNAVFYKNNNSLSYVDKNINLIADNTSLSSSESARDISTPNMLNTNNAIFPLNEELLSTAVVNSTNSSYLFDSSAKLRNYGSLIEMDTILQNYTINSSTKKVPYENSMSDNNLLNLNLDIKVNNETFKGNNNNVIENHVIFTDIGNLQAKNFSSHTILDPTLRFYDMATDLLFENNTSSLGNNDLNAEKKIDINLQKVKTPYVNTTDKSDIQFRELETTTFMSNLNNSNYNLFEIFKPVYVENIFVDNNQTNLKITTVEHTDERELKDNVTLNNHMGNEPKQKLNINISENQNVPVNNVKQPSIRLTHEKIIKDLQGYQPINEQINAAIATETIVNVFDSRKDVTFNRKTDENANHEHNTPETTLETPYFEKRYKNITKSDENSIKSTTDSIRSEKEAKLNSTETLLNPSNKLLESITSNKKDPYKISQYINNLTQVLSVYAKVNETKRKNLFSVITTTEKTYFPTDSLNVDKVNETAPFEVNIVEEKNPTKNEINGPNRIVLNSTLTNLTQVTSILDPDSENLKDKLVTRYLSAESNLDILSKTKDLEHTSSMLIPNALYEVFSNDTEIITEQKKKSFKNIDALNNTVLSDLEQSEILLLVNNITDIGTSTRKENEFLQPTTHFDDFLLVTPESNQLNLQGLNKTAGVDTETIQNREQKLDGSENHSLLNSVLNNKEIKQNCSNYPSITAPFILFNKSEDFVSTETQKKSTTDSSLKTDMLPMQINMRISNDKSNDFRLMTNNMKQVINNSLSQAEYDNNKTSDFSVADIFKNVSLKLPSYHIGIRNREKNNITNINLIKGLFQLQSPLIKDLNLSYTSENSTETPSSLKFTTHLENNQTPELLNIGGEIKLHGSGRINVTAYSDSRINKNELMKNKSITKYVTTTTFKPRNYTTNFQVTYHNNNLIAHTAADTSISEMRTSIFHCKNNFRGKFADKDNCRKFYICIGNSIAVVGLCPINTVFSEFRKQCTNNLSHCVRNNQFQCTSEGRFSDIIQENIYYICIKGLNKHFTRFKFQCQNGYCLDKKDMICKKTEKTLNSSSSSSSSSNDISKNKSLENDNTLNKKQNFKCEKEGKFADPCNARRYYICSKTSKSILRRRRKKCDSDEVFDNDKNKCVDKDSHEFS